MLHNYSLTTSNSACWIGLHSFVNIKTILGTSPDSSRRFGGSDLGSNCLQGFLEAIFLCHFPDELIC